jgi:hypothetical protein
MDGLLSMPDIEQLVATRASQLDRALRPEHVHVHEAPYATDDGALIVQIAVKRPDDQKEWIKLRLRLSQAIRDALLERGDERYPLLEVFEPEEWAGRDD